jgi:aminoglycoside phosphotransferase (APT) family kinase protein
MHGHLSAFMARAMGLSPTAIWVSSRRPLDHQSNRLYDVWADGRHFILKEYLKPDEFREASAREFGALELLAPLEIAPQPVLRQPEPVPPLGPVVVYEFMDGEMWDRRRPTAADLAALADVWLRMHAVSQENLWMSRGYERSFAEIGAHWHARLQAYCAWVDAEFPKGRGAADLCLAALENCRAVARELAGRSPLLCFCRGDARFANVIARPDGRLGLVDWEDSGLRDPARDVADLLTHANQEDLLPTDEWQAFLQPYLTVRGAIDPQLRHRLHLYLALFPVFWLVLLIDLGMRLANAGHLANWTINGLPANQRLRRYLARALAWPEVTFTDQLAALQGLDFFPTAASSWQHDR